MEGGGNDKKRGYKEYVFSSFVTSYYNIFMVNTPYSQ